MKNTKGITLIALVVTIIVLLILAGVAINLVAGGDGIMAKAQNALIQNNVAEAKECVNLKIAEFKTDFYNAVYVEKSVSVNMKLGDWIAEEHGGEVIKAGDYEFKVTTEENELLYKVTIFKNNKLKESIVGEMSSDGKIAWADETGKDIVPEEPDPEPEQPQEPEITPDTTAPTVPTSLTLTSTDTTITAVASGSTDDVDSEVIYEYSMDNSAWHTSGEFTDLTAETTYTVYARAKDAAGNASETIQNSVKTKYTQIAVNTIVQNKNATVTGNKPSTTNPVIPVGFRAVETTDATWEDSDSDGNPDGWNNGLVIEDSSYNQFVWVPVDGTTIEYAKNFNYPSNYGATTENTSDDADALPTDASGNTILEASQISTYGGFYVGRYEAGVPANQTAINGTSAETSDKDGIPVVQKGATVWTFISYDKAMPNAKKLYANSSSVRSGLLTGTQWDTVCAWIDSEKDSEDKSIHNVLDSTTWGNYTDTTGDAQYDTDGTTKISGIKQTAGKSEYWKAKNIYDLAGNTYEWIGEMYSSYRIKRGGDYGDYSSDDPVSYRHHHSTSGPTDYLSFRIVLYVM